MKDLMIELSIRGDNKALQLLIDGAEITGEIVTVYLMKKDAEKFSRSLQQALERMNKDAKEGQE